jgi:hypothetical protein
MMRLEALIHAGSSVIEALQDNFGKVHAEGDLLPVSTEIRGRLPQADLTAPTWDSRPLL